MLMFAMMGHAATATAAATATPLPKGLDLVEKITHLSNESGEEKHHHHRGKKRPFGYQATLIDRARKAGKGTEAQLSIGKGSASLQAADDIVNQIKRSATGGIEVMAHKRKTEDVANKKKHDLKPKPDEER